MYKLPNFHPVHLKIAESFWLVSKIAHWNHSSHVTHEKMSVFSTPTLLSTCIYILLRVWENQIKSNVPFESGIWYFLKNRFHALMKAWTKKKINRRICVNRYLCITRESRAETICLTQTNSSRWETCEIFFRSKRRSRIETRESSSEDWIRTGKIRIKLPVIS